jgi:hypothetical protein
MKVRDLLLVMGGWRFVKVSDSDYDRDDDTEDNIVDQFSVYNTWDKNRDVFDKIVKYSEISFDEDYDIILTIYI